MVRPVRWQFWLDSLIVWLCAALAESNDMNRWQRQPHAACEERVWFQLLVSRYYNIPITRMSNRKKTFHSKDRVHFCKALVNLRWSLLWLRACVVEQEGNSSKHTHTLTQRDTHTQFRAASIQAYHLHGPCTELEARVNRVENKESSSHAPCTGFITCYLIFSHLLVIKHKLK